MFSYHGNNVYMPVGDYGVPLTFHVKECCKCCAEELIETDQIRFVLSKDGAPIITREWQLGELEDGSFSVELTQEESGLLPLGTYSWRLFLIREGETKNNLTGGLWTVGSQMKRS